MRRRISSIGTGFETSSNSLQYVHARLQRRMGTMCAMYGCDVLATALAIEPISRSFREAAIRRRRAVMRRAAGAVPGAGLAVCTGCVSVGMSSIYSIVLD